MVAIALVPAASASFAVVGANGGDGEAYEQYVATDAMNASVRITMSGNTYGSGGLFHVGTSTVNNETYLNLCFATADHVVRPGTIDELKFQGSTDKWDLVPGGLWQSSIVLGGADGNDDLAFVGFRAKQNDLNLDFLDFVTNIALPNLATPGTGEATNYGYGSSARYLRDGNNDVSGFYWRPGFNAGGPDSNYIHHRYVKSDVTSVSNNAYSIYDFEAIKWQVSNATEFGGINQGDSGGMILQNGNFVGVNSYNTYIEGNDLNGLYRIYELGSNQGGNAFTQANIDWLNGRCMDFEAVPEPGTLALGAGLAALALRRRNRG
ncbi:MAG: PEP-CTERM sorting domain-containing protein [Armatimonadetes bacterium]|nr:PEP-CTERM sorting domain-containing protein [Armatimonadota bacterium]